MYHKLCITYRAKVIDEPNFHTGIIFLWLIGFSIALGLANQLKMLQLILHLFLASPKWTVKRLLNCKHACVINYKDLFKINRKNSDNNNNCFISPVCLDTIEFCFRFHFRLRLVKFVYFKLFNFSVFCITRFVYFISIGSSARSILSACKNQTISNHTSSKSIDKNVS